MYKVVSILFDGVTLKGYRLVNLEKEDEQIKIPESNLVSLIKSGEISDVSLIEDEGKEYITGLRLRELPVESAVEVTVKDKIKDGSNSVVGYLVTDTSGRERKISTKKAWELAACGGVTNAKASFFRKDDNTIKKYVQVEDNDKHE